MRLNLARWNRQGLPQGQPPVLADEPRPQAGPRVPDLRLPRPVPRPGTNMANMTAIQIEADAMPGAAESGSLLLQRSLRP